MRLLAILLAAALIALSCGGGDDSEAEATTTTTTTTTEFIVDRARVDFLLTEGAKALRNALIYYDLAGGGHPQTATVDDIVEMAVHLENVATAFETQTPTGVKEEPAAVTAESLRGVARELRRVEQCRDCGGFEFILDEQHLLDMFEEAVFFAIPFGTLGAFEVQAMAVP